MALTFLCGAHYLLNEKPVETTQNTITMKTFAAITSSLLFLLPAFAADPAPSTAGTAINALAIDLLHQMAKPDANIILSPYSIQSALAMTYAGAAGVTKDEMTKVLHYPANESDLHRAFSDLQKALEAIRQRSEQRVSRQRGAAAGDPIQLNIANRLYGQQGFPFRETFLSFVKNTYGAPLEQVDFKKNAEGIRKNINSWVEDQTKKRIRDLIPQGGLDALNRLVLVNAVYLKAPWQEAFLERSTKPLPFRAKGGTAVDVPTMTQKSSMGYAKYNGFSAVTIPYNDAELQFLILLPDEVNGLAALEQKITAEQLAKGARLPHQEITIYLPKFKVESPTMPLGQKLKALGMKTAFSASADFDRMAPKSSDPLYISEVFHKTFMAVDEKGTEAAAATAVAMRTLAMPMEPAQPIVVRVDHPFLLAIQHRDTGACLFIGHMTDPR
jgi:serpin B